MYIEPATHKGAVKWSSSHKQEFSYS